VRSGVEVQRENLSGIWDTMNLIFVLESWNAGGTEQYVRVLGQALKRMDERLSIHLVLVGDSEPILKSDQEPWLDRCSVLGDRGGLRWSELRRLIRKERPAICHLHLYTSTLPATIAVKTARTGTSLLTTFHSPISQWHWRHRAAFRIAVSMADTVIGASEFTSGELRPWRGDVVTASPSVVVPPAMVIDRDTERRSGEFRIVGCGRLSREKDWATLIKAVSLCSEDFPVVCDLIGSGPTQADLEQQITDSAVRDRVRLLGRLAHEETLRRVAGADLFVLPSRFEGFGIAAVEAMSLGVPTITADFPASTEYIRHGDTGHNFPFGDAHALAELIRWHLRHPRDSKGIAERGRSSVVERFSADRNAELHLRLYRESCGAALAEETCQANRQPKAFSPPASKNSG
jgi:glycosyltransferase involved in cell wall biosynthesis